MAASSSTARRRKKLSREAVPLLTNFDSYRQMFRLYNLAQSYKPDQAMIARLVTRLRISNFDLVKDVPVLEDTLLAYEQKIARQESVDEPYLRELAILLELFERVMLEEGGVLTLATLAHFAYYSKLVPIWKLENYYRHHEITNDIQGLRANYLLKIEDHLLKWKVINGAEIDEADKHRKVVLHTQGQWGIKSDDGDSHIYLAGLAKGGHVDLLPPTYSSILIPILYDAVKAGHTEVFEKYKKQPSFRRYVNNDAEIMLEDALRLGQYEMYLYLLNFFKGLPLDLRIDQKLIYAASGISLGILRKIRHSDEDSERLFGNVNRVLNFLYVALSVVCNVEIVEYLIASVGLLGLTENGTINRIYLTTAAKRGDYILGLVKDGLTAHGIRIADNDDDISDTESSVESD